MKKRAKIKSNKEVYCVGVDYYQRKDGEYWVAVALVDRVVYIYKAKRFGSKIGFVSIANFRIDLKDKPSPSMISNISLDENVTGTPLLFVGSFQGEIKIYEIQIDPEFEGLTEKQKLERCKEGKLVDNGSIQFFSRNHAKQQTDGNFPIR